MAVERPLKLGVEALGVLPHAVEASVIEAGGRSDAQVLGPVELGSEGALTASQRDRVIPPPMTCRVFCASTSRDVQFNPATQPVARTGELANRNTNMHSASLGCRWPYVEKECSSDPRGPMATSHPI